MDAIIARIKEYALKLNSALSNNSDLFEFVINDVVDRALAFTNRDQLVYQYEKDLISYPTSNTLYNDFWACYELPIPARLERLLAGTVVGVYRNIKYQDENGSTGAVKSISDNGQSISYSEQIANFLNSSDDAEIFSGSVKLLERYLIPVIPHNENSRQF
jgi:hypothetical protein